MKMTKLGLGFLVGTSVIALSGVGLVTGGLVKTFVKSQSSSSSTAVKKVQSIFVSVNPTRMVYIVGQNFDKTGMVVEALYEDESTEPIENYTVSNAAAFAEEKQKEAVSIEYIDGTGTSFETELSVRVVETLDGVGEAIGLSPVTGPLVQKQGSKFDWTGLSFHVLYNLDGFIGEGQKVYTKGQNIDGNSYNTLKLVDDVALTKDTKAVDFSYSQGKSVSIPVAVASKIDACSKKTSYVSGTDKFNFSDITVAPTIVNGVTELGVIKAESLKWSDNIEGQLTDGFVFSFGGSHTITASYNGVWSTISFTITVIGGSDPIVENKDKYEVECENMTIAGASALVQTGADYNTQYTDSNCEYGSFHAAAYLGYTGKYACSGSPYGGFVHNFDTSKTASMTYEFYTPAGGYADLIVTGASNDATPSTYSSNALNVVKAAKFSLNSTDISGSLDSTKAFAGISNPSATADVQNRTGKVGTISLSGRYVFLNWTELNMGKIALAKGKNTLVITPNNGNKSGHWDKIKIDCTPYKG